MKEKRANKHYWNKALTSQMLDRVKGNFSGISPTQLLVPPSWVDRGERHKYLWRVRVINGIGKR